MAIDPATLVTVGTAIVSRFIDKESPIGKTNTTTVVGLGGFGGAALYLINQPDETMQLVGYSLGVVGALVSLYKDKK